METYFSKNHCLCRLSIGKSTRNVQFFVTKLKKSPVCKFILHYSVIIAINITWKEELQFTGSR